MQRFLNKHAVVTGAGSGIGQAIALRLAAEGATVWVLDRDEEAGLRVVGEITEAGGVAEFAVCDVASEAAVNAALARPVQVDVLVNNAGIAHIGNVEQTTPEDMDRIYSVNVKGVHHCLRAGVGRMMAQGGGVILNMASVAAKVGIADRFAYSMSKGAVLAMTLSVAKDYATKGIRCNCLCPARVHTPFVDGYLAAHYPGSEEEMFSKLSAWQPVGRMAQPEEIAAAAAWLCSDEAAFVTGSAVDIDGGVTRLR